MDSQLIRVFLKEPFSRSGSRAVDKARAADLAVSQLSLTKKAHEEVIGDRAFYDRNGIRLTRLSYWVGYHGIGVAHLENLAEFEIEPMAHDFQVVEDDAPTRQLRRAVLQGSQGEVIARIIVPRWLYWKIVESEEFERDWGWNHSPNEGEPAGACALDVEGTRIWLESERHVTMRSARRG